MNNTEAIEIIKTAIANVEWDYPMDYAAAFEKAVEALKEQEPKPVKVVKNAYNHEFYYCPRCNRSFYELFFAKPKFCDKCGQAVKWE